MDLAEIIDDDEKVKERDNCGDQVERAPAGSKRQRPEEFVTVDKMTRKSLRETLIAKASELRSVQASGMEVQPNMPRPENATKKTRIHGNDAVARIINAGRDCEDCEHHELKVPVVPGKPVKAKLMRGVISSASDSAGLVVVRGADGAL